MKIKLADLNVLEMEKCFDIYLSKITISSNVHTLGLALKWEDTNTELRYWLKLFSKAHTYPVFGVPKNQPIITI